MTHALDYMQGICTAFMVRKASIPTSTGLPPCKGRLAVKILVAGQQAKDPESSFLKQTFRQEAQLDPIQSHL